MYFKVLLYLRINKKEESEIKRLPRITQFGQVRKSGLIAGFLVSHCAIKTLKGYHFPCVALHQKLMFCLYFLVLEVTECVADRSYMKAQLGLGSRV